MTNSLRTSAGSHERTMAGAANRSVIPEHKFDIERLTELLVSDRQKNPSHYSVVLVSEGAMFQGGEMVFEAETTNAFGHQKLGCLVRCGDPDAIDSIVPMAYGNLAL